MYFLFWNVYRLSITIKEIQIKRKKKPYLNGNFKKCVILTIGEASNWGLLFCWEIVQEEYLCESWQFASRDLKCAYSTCALGKLSDSIQ